MNNQDIAQSFKLLADLMDFYGENKFKVRSYNNAYSTLRKIEAPLSEMSVESLAEIEGVGVAISKKIKELIESGEMKALKAFTDKTPEGIIELLGIRGIGTTKIKTAWQDGGITTPEAFYQAALDNELVRLSGFGSKTQKDIQNKLEYYLSTRNLFLYSEIHEQAEKILSDLRSHFPAAKIDLCGDIRLKRNVVKGIEIITDEPEVLQYVREQYQDYEITVDVVEAGSYGTELFRRSASEEFLDAVPDLQNHPDEAAVWNDLKIMPVPEAYRESAQAFNEAREGKLPDLIEVGDIRGIIHNHSTYSDGIHDLEDMAQYVKDAGYGYFVISDHSKSAGYANGLSYERVEMQWREIDELNANFEDFRVFKGIECDILSDGSMDYEDDFLKQFEVVVASIHSGLNMTSEKATARLIKAIENPYVDILGHLTGRLLLTRPGYPVDHKKIIDACIQNDVVIELNANPRRLDMDWSYLPYALEKGAMISINPDAHSKGQVGLIEYGVISARKGGLTPDSCLSCYSLEQFSEWVDARK